MITADMQGIEELRVMLQKAGDLDPGKFFKPIFRSVVDEIEAAIIGETPINYSGYPKSRRMYGGTYGNKKYTSRNHPAGTLADSVGSKIGGKDIPTAWVSLRRKNIEQAWYSHIVVGGHKWKSFTVKPNPIIPRAWNKVRGRVTNSISQGCEKKLKRLLKKANAA